MHSEKHLYLIAEVGKKSNLAIRIIALLEDRLNYKSPFVEITQAEIAARLGTTPNKVSEAISLILTQEIPLLFKVKAGVFMVNLQHCWKCKLELRRTWELYLQDNSIESAYEIHQAGKVIERLAEYNPNITKLYK